MGLGGQRQAYVYPKGMRETRDLLRRPFLVRRRAEALVHLSNTNSQYNLPPFAKKLAYAASWGRHLACQTPGRQDACPTTSGSISP